MIPGNIDVPTTHTESACAPIRQVLDRVADKWSLLIVMTLAAESRRFNELRRLIHGISQRMLTHTLRELERDGLVLRIVTPTVPPRVDYKLTPLGFTFIAPVQSMVEWALANSQEMNAARKSYDERPPLT